MKYFVPLSDEMLFSDSDMKRYRLVPYNPDFIHIRSRKRCNEKPATATHIGRKQHAQR
ncbi:MAG: hypothetical protein OQK12_11730 [Motiliproteus sp.]|nr:hypothetical protein [Motiliproteus sp.]MCW9051665.1 hypothetical protein [Motiliproteus sp.]